MGPHLQKAKSLVSKYGGAFGNVERNSINNGRAEMPHLMR